MLTIGDSVRVNQFADFISVSLFRGKVGKIVKIMPTTAGEHNVQVEYPEPIYPDDDPNDTRYWFYDYELEKVN